MVGKKATTRFIADFQREKSVICHWEFFYIKGLFQTRIFENFSNWNSFGVSLILNVPSNCQIFRGLKGIFLGRQRSSISKLFPNTWILQTIGYSRGFSQAAWTQFHIYLTNLFMNAPCNWTNQQKILSGTWMQHDCLWLLL